MPTGLIPFTDLFRTATRDLGGDVIRLPGETDAAAYEAASRSFGKAESALQESFLWWKG